MSSNSVKFLILNPIILVWNISTCEKYLMKFLILYQSIHILCQNKMKVKISIFYGYIDIHKLKWHKASKIIISRQESGTLMKMKTRACEDIWNKVSTIYSLQYKTNLIKIYLIRNIFCELPYNPTWVEKVFSIKNNIVYSKESKRFLKN